MLQFTENRQRSTGLALRSNDSRYRLSVSTNPRAVLRGNGLAEATQAEALAGTIQHRYMSPLRVSQVVAGLADGDLTKVDDTNVTLTLGGTPTDALWNDVSITVGWTGTLANARLAPMNAYTLKGRNAGTSGDPGDIDVSALTEKSTLHVDDLFIIQDAEASNAFKKVKKSNITPTAAALTRVDDTNVTLTLGGTPTTALLAATSLTVGWSGTLAVARGGTGAGTLTGLLQGNGTSAFTVISDSSTVGQVLRVTGAATYGWGAVDLADGDAVTGTLPVGNGGTGITAFGTGVATALGVNVGSAGAFVTFNGAGGTPSSLTLTNATGLPSIVAANEATDTSCFISFFTAASGELGPKTNANMTFNSNTGVATFASTVLTTTDINGGTVDGAAIGGASASTGSFTTLAASGLISANGGQVAFPSSQNASADANTLDDYEEGTYTPVITFATLGNLSVTYTLQAGVYTKIGRFVAVAFQLTTSAFTHTTASGNLEITGLPFTIGASIGVRGPIQWQGITKAGYTHVVTNGPATTTLFRAIACASASAVSNVTATDMPTGGSVQLQGSAYYFV